MQTTTAAAETPTLAQGRDVPDLALVMVGSSGRTTAVRSGEPDFARLWQLLQPMHSGTERVPEAWEEGRYPLVRLTVVWGLTGIGGWPLTNGPPDGDVAIERQDQLLVAADGTPWVRSDPAPEVEDDDIRWHRAPRSVFDQLYRQGLLGMSGKEAFAYGGAREASWVHASDFWWVPGVAVGLVVGAGGTLLIRRAAARQGAGPPREEPRQELIDL
ncbi:hypothetical protein [Streptomyces sp. NPDC001401]|uniref:hypothetical protein n=1 Tax=Streptomyces sp. NPDC001401 TaxID=3364570 RepID=UPI00369B59F1